MYCEFRDPVHGPIAVSEAEYGVITQPAFQRLARIKQLGFGEATFPGASHTRYLHSLGAMHLAGRAFEALSLGLEDLDRDTQIRLCAVARLAALLHDIGHPPLSHQMEFLLPPLAELDLPTEIVGNAKEGERAAHEHMSLLLLLRSSLADAINDGFADMGLKAMHVAEVLCQDLHPHDPGFFEHNGRSLLPLLRNLVSGELDCDRMDYLRRDAYFAGVSYGKYDQAWILSNLVPVLDDGCYELGLDAGALHAFEDFLLARHHMFLMVYAHRHTLILDKMLRLFVQTTPSISHFPSDPESYIECDDGLIMNLLREHQDNPWAQRVFHRRAISCALEIDEDRDGLSALTIEKILKEHGVEFLSTYVHSPFSAYAPGGKTSSPPLRFLLRDRVVEPHSRSVQDITDLYARYQKTPKLVRIHVLESYRERFEELRRSGALRQAKV